MTTSWYDQIIRSVGRGHRPPFRSTMKFYGFVALYLVTCERADMLRFIVNILSFVYLSTAILFTMPVMLSQMSAQDRLHDQIVRNTNRLDNLERQQILDDSFRVSAIERLTALEERFKSLNEKVDAILKLLYAICVAVATALVERIVSYAKGKRARDVSERSK